MLLLRKIVNVVATVLLAQGMIFYGGSYMGVEIQGPSDTINISLMVVGAILLLGKFIYFDKTTETDYR